jgi:predicted dithiol-disulfide oxidoreductase (DUF899 family)
MTTHKVVKHGEWLKARRRHLAKEKEFTRLRDQLSRERRELPWELVEKHYTFEGEHGRQTLSDLFEGRGQLVIYHAMFNPDSAGADTTWTADAPCFVCSFWMDNFNGITIHLNHRDITMAAISLAPYPKLAAYKKRMGWGFPWLSSLGSDFNFDYRRILGRPVHLDPLDLRPRLVVDVGSADAAGQVDHLVPGASQPRNQEAADVSAAANYHDAHDS